MEHTYGHQKYDESTALEDQWNDLSCDDRDRCGNYHSDRLSRLSITKPMMTDQEFEKLCVSKIDKREMATT